MDAHTAAKTWNASKHTLLEIWARKREPILHAISAEQGPLDLTDTETIVPVVKFHVRVNRSELRTQPDTLEVYWKDVFLDEVPLPPRK